VGWKETCVNVAPVRRVAVVTGLAALSWAPGARAQLSPPAPETLAVGDWKLAPLLEVRARGEYRHDVDAQDKGTLGERVRLGVDAERGPVEARVVLQDARLWNMGLIADVVGQPAPFASTGAYEAWGEAHTAGARPSFVRVGRQPVTWGEGRLLGVADWSPAGRSLDAVRGRLALGDWAFEALAAGLVDPAPQQVALVGAFYAGLLGVRAQWALDPLLAFELYGLARFAQASPSASLEDTVHGETYTGALRAHGEGHAWGWGVEGAYQGGHVAHLSEDRSAWAAAGHVGYTLEHVLLLPTVRLGAAYASGDGGGGGTYKAFDPILPDVHVWHGAMDLFAWSNEAEASARAAIAPWTDAVAAVEYRYVRLAEPGGAWRTAYLATVGAAPQNGDGELGHEIDATLRWSPWVPVELSAGYSAAILGGGAKAILSAREVGTVQSSGTIAQPGVVHFAYAGASVRLP
jgi:hypothetical protein